MRKELALFAAIAALFALVATSAQSMPVSALKGIAKSDAKSDQTITLVRGGCGRGWHRGPRGHCRRN